MTTPLVGAFFLAQATPSVLEEFVHTELSQSPQAERFEGNDIESMGGDISALDIDRDIITTVDCR